MNFSKNDEECLIEMDGVQFPINTGETVTETENVDDLVSLNGANESVAQEEL